MKKRAHAWEQIPELLRPQNCAGEIRAGVKWQDNDDDATSSVRPCPDPAVWFNTATGSPFCDAHKQHLENLEHHREITPP